MTDPDDSEFEAQDGQDVLLDCMVLVSKFKRKALSHEGLRAGIPLENNKFNPSLLVRAVRREGYSAEIMEKTIDEMNDSLFPCILLLHGNTACILKKRDRKGRYCCIFPGEKKHKQVLSLVELTEKYNGYAIMVQPKFSYNDRNEALNEVTKKSWFWGTLWKFRRIYFEVFVATFLVNVFAIITPLYAMNVYDRVVPNQAYETLWVLSIGIAIIYILSFVMDTVREYFLDMASKKTDMLLSSVLFEKVLNIPMEYKPLSVGSFASNIKEFDSLRQFFSSATIVSFIDVPFAGLFLLVIWMLAGNMVWIPVAAIPIVIICAILAELPLKRSVQKMSAAASQKNASLIEALTGLETIKTLAAEGIMQRRYEHSVSISSHAGQTVSLLSSISKNMTKLILQFVYLATIVYGVFLISSGDLSMGGLIACSLLGNKAVAPLSKVASLIGKLQQTMASFDSLNKIMDLPGERDGSKNYISCKNFKGHIKFENVSFTYPGRSEPLLTDVSFEIQPGEHVAIMGENGCGKSTILKLLTRLYTPSSGSITIDDVDIQHCNPSELRQKLSYLSQDYTLFFGSLRENITFSAPWLSDDNLINVSQITGVDKFVAGHSGGYEVTINERGDGLSGGQRQAIALARCLFPNPDILLLDEPTSAIDVKLEHHIFNQLDKFSQDKTLLLVTHRVTLLELVNRIIVIDKGQVAYDGPKKG